MKKLNILNSKEKKGLFDVLAKQWSIDEKNLKNIFERYAFLESEKGKIYLINKEISMIDDKKLRIDSIGLYFAARMKKGIRLSIEGSQIIGKIAESNIMDITGKEAVRWMNGLDIECKNCTNGFVIIRHKDDFMGCGKVVGNKILNYVPKARRISQKE